MNVLDLFSGIGGFSLGLERAGMKTIAFCEIEPYCRRVLRHHWPDVFQYEDVKTATEDNIYHATGYAPCEIDLICGGFPCQGLSLAGLGKGLADVRSALWFEYLRIITEFRPRWVIIENVPALRSRGLDVVLGGLAAIGYDAEWNCIPAAAFGAPHRRDRVWITAYPAGERRAEDGRHRCDQSPERLGRSVAENSAQPASIGCGEGRQGRLTDRLAWIRDCPRWHPADTDYEPRGSGATWEDWEEVGHGPGGDVWQSRWTDEPALCGVDDGIQAGVDLGLYALGNSIVPQIAEAHGRAIMNWENEHATV